MLGIKNKQACTNFAENYRFMQRFFLHRAIKKYIRTSNRRKQFVSFSKAKNILLLYECEEAKTQTIQEIIFQLSALGKDVFSICFIKNGHSNEENTNQVRFIDKKDVNFLKMPKNNILEELTGRRFDLLLDLTASENISLLYIALFANATMKASSHTYYSGIFDFILDTEKLAVEKKTEDFKNFERFVFEKLTFYLKTIRTSD